MKILFVCSSNICRSPYCEMVFKKMVENNKELSKKVTKITSAAVFNKSFHIHSKARLALQREGFSENEINAHKPRYIFEAWKDFKEADVIIGMNNFNKIFTPYCFRKKFKTLSEVAIGKYEDIPDPFLMKNMEDYYKVMDIIKKYLELYEANLLK